MYGDEDEDFPDDGVPDFADDEEAGDEEMDSEMDVVCPFCGESVTITLDPGGGAEQEYVEDCEVCCRPWKVKVHYDETGAADVSLEQG